MNDEVKKVLFIINKFSGGGFLPAMEKNILEFTKLNKAEVALAFTEGRGHATALTRGGVRDGFTHVVAVGGDGTVNEVAQGLLHSGVTMGIIPKGSGNGLARHLRIPIRMTDALRCLYSSDTIVMDTFRMNDRLSVNVSGIGFDGHIANLFGQEKRRGLQGYSRITWNEFRNFSEFETAISIGNTQLRRTAFVIAIANSSQYGNNARIAPAASVCDGLLHISILKKMPPYRLDFLYSFFAGTITGSPYFETLEARDLVITLNTPAPFHIDGESSGHASLFHIGINPASLRVVAPVKGCVV